MNLLIDSGNSFIKYSLADDSAILKSDSCASTSVTVLSELWKSYDKPERVIVANVAGDKIGRKIHSIAADLWQLEAEFVTSEVSCCGLINSYHKPEQLGVDRWLAMIAAYSLSKSAVIVVDCGTAVTIDLVKEDGLFVGGVILPGLNTALQSLQSASDALDETGDESLTITATAQSTAVAVQSGVLLGLAGAIDSIVSKQSALLNKAPVLMITGGDAEQLMPYLQSPLEHQPGLVLRGLQVFTTAR